MFARVARAVRRFTSVAGLLVFALGSTVSAQQSVTISDESITGLGSETLVVSATTDTVTEGFVLAIGYDTALVSVVDVNIVGTSTDTAGAELVVGEIFDGMGGVTLGVVLDSAPPFLGQTIPAGAVTLANIDVTADGVVGANTDVSFDFVDNTFNNPVLNNILVQGGQSVGILANTTTTAGTLTLLPPPPDSLTIEDVAIPAGGTGCARILLNNSTGPVQGFVLSITHEPGVTLSAITLTGTITESVGAEFVVPTVEDPAVGGTLAVVLDFNSPFGGQTIPVAADNHIANFCYTCNTAPIEPEPAEVFDVEFNDGAFGSPALDNVIVVAGLSFMPSQNNGTVTCLPAPAVDTEFLCGGPLDEFGEPTDSFGSPGDTTEVCVYYVDPTDAIQGFQLALCMPLESIGVLEFVEESFSIEDTILEAVGTEFLAQSQDNDPNDGDGVEMTVGILLDALPPFDDQTVPPTAVPLEIGCFDVRIDANAPCDTCFGIDFCDFVNAAEALPIENLAVVEFGDVRPQQFSCRVCTVLTPEFMRGDCTLDEKVNIADAAAILGAQFQDLMIGCEDACDANDDGKINLADTVALLNYLFKSGATPPDPGPDIDPGVDPTPDDLGCEQGTNVCF